MSYIDFAELKREVSILQVADLLDLELKKDGEGFRTECPHCQSGKRTLVINEGKQAFFCFTENKGGDCISLVAHVKNIGVKDAALFIHSSLTVPAKVTGDLEPLQHLDTNHEAVVALMTPADAQRIGAGYAKKGILRGHIAWPIRLEDGTLIGYIGTKPDAELKLPKAFRFPNNVVPLKRPA